jgi:hypothetical protein
MGFGKDSICVLRKWCVGMYEGNFVAYYRVSTDRQGRSGLGSADSIGISMTAGAKPGERRGGREKGTPNKATLVRMDEAAAEVANARAKEQLYKLALSK